MCKIPKVVIVSPSGEHADLRRRLSSLEYEIAATLAPGDPLDVSADVLLLYDPDPATLEAARAKAPAKVVVVGAPAEGAHLVLDRDDDITFKSRIWELFRPVR